MVDGRRCGSATWSADPEVVAACELVALPYHLDAVKQLAGRLALRYVDRDGGPGGPGRRGAGADRRRLRPPARRDVAVGRQLHPLPARLAGRPGEVWTDLLDRSVLVRDCSEWPGLAGCLRVTVGLPEENDRFLAALTESLR